MYIARGEQTAWATVCFHYCPCHSYLRPLDTALLFYFKRIKTAPDTSIPTRGIEKHLACRLPGLPPRMSASDEGEKNDALYDHCKKPFIQPQLSHRECVALTHGGWNRTSTDPVPAVPTQHNTSIDLDRTALLRQHAPWFGKITAESNRRRQHRQSSAGPCSTGSVNTCTDEKANQDTKLSPRQNHYSLLATPLLLLTELY